MSTVFIPIPLILIKSLNDKKIQQESVESITVTEIERDNILKKEKEQMDLENLLDKLERRNYKLELEKKDKDKDKEKNNDYKQNYRSKSEVIENNVRYSFQPDEKAKKIKLLNPYFSIVRGTD